MSVSLAVWSFAVCLSVIWAALLLAAVYGFLAHSGLCVFSGFGILAFLCYGFSLPSIGGSCCFGTLFFFGGGCASGLGALSELSVVSSSPFVGIVVCVNARLFRLCFACFRRFLASTMSSLAFWPWLSPIFSSLVR